MANDTELQDEIYLASVSASNTHPIIQGKQINLDETAYLWMHDWISAKEEVKRYNKMAKEAQAKLLEFMQDNEIGLLRDGAKLIRNKVEIKSYTIEASSYISLSYKGAKSGKN